MTINPRRVASSKAGVVVATGGVGQPWLGGEPSTAMAAVSDVRREESVRRPNCTVRPSLPSVGWLHLSARFSLVIPAWNEEALLPRLLDTVDVARARFRRGADAVEVIVADNASPTGARAGAWVHGGAGRAAEDCLCPQWRGRGGARRRAGLRGHRHAGAPGHFRRDRCHARYGPVRRRRDRRPSGALVAGHSCDLASVDALGRPPANGHRHHLPPRGLSADRRVRGGPALWRGRRAPALDSVSRSGAATARACPMRRFP